MAKAKTPAKPKRKPKEDAAKKPPAAPKKKPKKGGGNPEKPPAAPRPAVKANGEIDYGSPEFLALYDTETARVSGEQVTEVYRLKAEWEDVAAEAAKLKKQYESARAEHLSYVRKRIDERGRRPQATLMTGIEEQELKEKLAKERGDSPGTAAIEQKTADAKEQPTWFPDDLWKQFPIERISGYGLTAGDVAALAAGKVKNSDEVFPIEKMGQMSNFTTPSASGFTRKLTDIKGFGPAAQERWFKAETGFWTDWPTLREAFAVQKGYTRPDPIPDATTAAPAITEGATNADDTGTAPAGDGGETQQPTESGGEPGGAGDRADVASPAEADATKPADDTTAETKPKPRKRTKK